MDIKNSLLKMALKAIDADEIKSLFLSSIPGLIHNAVDKIENKFPLEADREFQHVALIANDRERVFLVLCTIDRNFNLVRKLEKIDLVELIQKTDVKKLIENLAK